MQVTKPLATQLIDAMAASGMTRYRIAAESGVSAGQLSRFVGGAQGLSVENLERVAHSIGFAVALVPLEAKAKPATKPSTKPSTPTTRKPTRTKGA